MATAEVHIYTQGDTLPDGLLEEKFFHSRQLFMLCKSTPRQHPYLLTIETPEKAVVAQLLAIVRHRASLFPPYYYRHCRVLGEGIYSASDAQRETQFAAMLQALTERLGHYMLYIEVSNLSQKLFGYKAFRQQDFFPIRWMSIHNSLHSHTPEERITSAMQQTIDTAYARGVVTIEVTTPEDFKAFSRLLRHHNWLKPKRYIPADVFFLGMQQQGYGRLFVTKYKEHVIGCSAVAYSEGQAYLWYSAFRRKSYARLHPDTLTIWHAIKDAHRRGYAHIFFMDVGLPFQKNPFREFILSFGGKPVSTYRWFRTPFKWVNAIASWIYRD